MKTLSAVGIVVLGLIGAVLVLYLSPGDACRTEPRGGVVRTFHC